MITNIKINSPNYFKIIIGIILIIGTITAIIYQYYNLTFELNRNKYFEIMNSYDNTKLIISDLKRENDSLIKSFNDTSQSNTDNDIKFKIIDIQLRNLEKKINQISEVTTGIRQSINPMNPDEILTIARLKDATNTLNSNLSKLEDTLNERQTSFEESIRHEISSSNQSTNLILVVLIPLVLNFLITLGKEFRKPVKIEKDKENKE